MKGSCQQVPLLSCDDAPVGQACQDLGIRGNRLDQRGADEDGMKRAELWIHLYQRGHIDLALEAGYLTAKCVALNLNIHQPEQRLLALDVFGKEDRPGTGTP